jgi:hypothetical protein
MAVTSLGRRDGADLHGPKEPASFGEVLLLRPGVHVLVGHPNLTQHAHEEAALLLGFAFCSLLRRLSGCDAATRQEDARGGLHGSDPSSHVSEHEIGAWPRQVLAAGYALAKGRNGD